MSETTVETATETTEPTATEGTETEPTTEQLQAEVDKWKALSKKNEERAKANTSAAKELEAHRLSAMSEQEKAVAQAKAEGLAEGARNAGIRLVDAEVRAAAAGRNVDTDALLEGLDRSKFLDDEGEPSRDAIQAFVDAIAPAPEEPEPTGFESLRDVQGTRTPAPGLGTDELTQSLARMVGARR